MKPFWCSFATSNRMMKFRFQKPHKRIRAGAKETLRIFVLNKFKRAQSQRHLPAGNKDKKKGFSFPKPSLNIIFIYCLTTLLTALPLSEFTLNRYIPEDKFPILMLLELSFSCCVSIFLPLLSNTSTFE